MSDSSSVATQNSSGIQKYQKDDNVILEPGQAELERLKLSHAIIMAHLDGLFPSPVLAPIDLNEAGLHFLDQACANGQWLNSVRKRISKDNGNHYVGTDVVASYFPHSPPAETSFLIQSMTDPWPESMKGTFDMVHSRYSLVGAGAGSMKQVIQAEIELLKPGGWIQLEEMDLQKTVGFPENGPAVTSLYKMLSEMFGIIGVGDKFAAQIKGWMMELGLTDIIEQDIVVKCGSSAQVSGFDGTSVERIREIGTEFMTITARTLIQGSLNLPTALKSVPQEELSHLPQRIREECDKIGSGYVMKVVYGRKPL